MNFSESTIVRGLAHYFLPRDAMRKRGLCCRPVSARLSVCHVRSLYPEGWRYRQNLPRPSSPYQSRFFGPRAPIPNSTGAQNMRGWGDFAIFDRSHRKRYEISPLLRWNVNRSYRWQIDPCSDLEILNATGHVFQADLLNNTRIVWPRTSDVKFHDFFCPEIFHEIFMKCFINSTICFSGFTLTRLTFLLYVKHYLSFIYAHCSSISLSAGLLAWFACLSTGSN